MVDGNRQSSKAQDPSLRHLSKNQIKMLDLDQIDQRDNPFNSTAEEFVHEIIFKPKESVIKAFEDENNQKEYLMERGTKPRLPEGFKEFVYSDLCAEFADSIYDYCIFLIKIEDKKLKLEEDARTRRLPMPRLLQSETDKLNRKAKRMADNYGRLIIMNRSIGWKLHKDGDAFDTCRDRLQFKSQIYKNKENDNGFFSAVVKLFGHALRKTIKALEAAEKGSEYMERVEIEIDRLFRTNVFNIAARNQERKKLLM